MSQMLRVSSNPIRDTMYSIIKQSNPIIQIKVYMMIERVAYKVNTKTSVIESNLIVF